MADRLREFLAVTEPFARTEIAFEVWKHQHPLDGDAVTPPEPEPAPPAPRRTRRPAASTNNPKD
jgi:hypothetical protein